MNHMNWIGLILKGAESVSLTYTAQSDGTFRVVVVPKLTAEADGLTEDARKIRALLAAPLVITATKDELSGGVDEKLLSLVQARSEVSDSFEEALAAMKNAGKSAANIAAKATAAAKKAATPAKAKADKVEAKADAAVKDAEGDDEADEKQDKVTEAAPVAQAAAPVAAKGQDLDLFAGA